MYNERGPFYDKYVSGFGDGLMDFVDNLHIKAPTLLDEPGEDVTDIYSIGCHDGYCHYLNLYKSGRNILLLSSPINVLANQYFMQAKYRYKSASKDISNGVKSR